MNVLDFVILAICAVLIFFAVRLALKRKKSGKCCSGNCTSCNKCK